MEKIKELEMRLDRIIKNAVEESQRRKWVYLSAITEILKLDLLY